MPHSDRAYTAGDAAAVKNAREHDAGFVYEVRSIACSWVFGGAVSRHDFTNDLSVGIIVGRFPEVTTLRLIGFPYW